jgi:selenide,water dikinase
VFRIDERTTLVQTIDFFTPVVDDPEAFGAIAAANALSDIYAMGGRPLTALSIACFPEKDFPPEWGAAIFRGGQKKLVEAGCALLGGHSVRDPEIKFGYAITGLVDVDTMMTNAAGRAGDVLVLTKPLGTGILATALKAGRAPAAATAVATQSMAQLNRIPSVIAARNRVRAATDVTGFGLVGHAAGIARESRITLEIRAEALPLLPSAVDLAPDFQPGGLAANRRQFGPLVRIAARAAAAGTPLEALLYDPQTSGGLLLLVPEANTEAVLSELPNARAIGVARDAGEHAIVIV